MLLHKPRPVLIFYIRQAFYLIYNPLKKLYWDLFRPRTNGVKILVFNNNKLLLTRIGYAHHQWVIPGGKVEKGEEPVKAAIRELKEETGIDTAEIRHIADCVYTDQDKIDTVHYYYAVTNEVDITIDDQEVIDAGWFDLASLPANRRLRVDEGIRLYNNWKDGQK